MNENAQRTILLALAASPEEMTMPMIRRAAGLPDTKDIYPRLNNLIVAGAIKRRTTASGERWFQLNLSWRSRYDEIATQVDRAVALRRTVESLTPVVDEPPTAGADRPTARAVPAAVRRPGQTKVDRVDRTAARSASLGASDVAGGLRATQSGFGVKRPPDAEVDDDIALGYALPKEEFAGYQVAPVVQPQADAPAARDQAPIYQAINEVRTAMAALSHAVLVLTNAISPPPAGAKQQGNTRNTQPGVTP